MDPQQLSHLSQQLSQLSQQLSQHVSLGENPYWLFISFLYAWIAAEIANCFHKVYLEQDAAKRARIGSHLILAALVVGTSWIAWTQAFVSGDVIAPKEVISLRALMVIIDFTILTMYFNFASIVGKIRKSNKESGDYQKHASFWVSLILTMYLAWDAFSYYLFPYLANSNHKTDFLRHSWSTALCVGIAWIVFYLQQHRHKLRDLVQSDISLIALILFFRALKQMSHTDPSLPILRQIWPQNGPRWLAIFALISLIVFVSAVWFTKRPKAPSHPTPAQPAPPQPEPSQATPPQPALVQSAAAAANEKKP
jgi:hypothetical protein